MLRATLLTVIVLSSFACPKAVPAPASAPLDGGRSEAELARARVDAIEREVEQRVRASDRALWSHWLTGEPLDAGVSDVALSRSTLQTLELARQADPSDVERIENLWSYVAGAVLARETAEASQTLANLEASATFVVDGKEFAFRDLTKLLLNEPSAVKRRALWSAALVPAQRLDAALAQRDVELNELAKSLGAGSLLELAARSRGTTLETLEQRAHAELDRTAAEWTSTLERLSARDVRLPVASLSRADLPRVLRVPPSVDASFPKSSIVERAKTVVPPGAVLELELSESPKKNPLPLTVVTDAVRVSLKPVGGLRDQQAVLGELAVASALFDAHSRPFALGRLQRPAHLMAIARGAMLQVQDEAWLRKVGITEPEPVVEMARALDLFSRRRAASLVLARLESARAGDEAHARARYVALMSAGLGVTVAPEEGVRFRLETHDFLRSASLLTP